MALEIPSEFVPLFQVYGIPWPDIDEDVFRELPQPLRNFGEDLTAVGDAIESALQDLVAGNSSQTLQAIQTYFQAIRRDFLDRVTDLCEELAGTPCGTAYQMIRDAKYVAIAALTCEVGNDIVDLASAVFTFGADSALAAAEAVAVREAISQSLKIGEAEIVSCLSSMANRYLDSFVNSIIEPFITSVSTSVENAVASYAPNLILRQVAGAEYSGLLLEDAGARRLHLSPSELETCIDSIWNSSQHLATAAQTLEGTVEELFSHPAPNVPDIPNVSSEMRLALWGVALTIRNDLVAAVEQLVGHVEQHFVTLLQDYVQALKELDDQGRMLASQQHASSGPNVVVLSAIGATAVASAEVTVTSGIVNVEEAETVQVEAASATDGTASIATETDPIFVDPEVASAQVSVDDMSLPGHTPVVRVAPVNSSHDTVELLKMRTPAEGSRGNLGHDDSAPTASVRVRGSTDRAPRVQDAPASHAKSSPSELHPRHPEHEVRNVVRAESAAQGVKDIRIDKVTEPKPVVDPDTSATDEVRDH